MPTPYAKIVAVIPAIMEFSKDHPCRSKYGSNMNNNVEGNTSHNILSAKSATCAVSLVSSYNHVNDNTLINGIEVINAPKTADFFAISLAITTTAPLKIPFTIKSSQFMMRELVVTNSSFPLFMFKSLIFVFNFVILGEYLGTIFDINL